MKRSGEMTWRDMEMIAVSFVPFLVFLVWLALIAYVITLARRLVYAAERIATALERNRPGSPSEDAAIIAVR